MEELKSIIKSRSQLLRGNNVNVDSNIVNNVYDDNVAFRISETVDKPRAIGEILSEKLNAPQNIKLYIKLANQYPIETLFECLVLTEEAYGEGRIKTTKSQYFYGIVRRKKQR